ncbi:MAG: AAA family ATPase [Christensenellales bacterium]
MADADKNAFIYDTFLMYYEHAKKAQERGDIAGAKENLLRAAQALVKLAKEDKGELKKARFDRANRLIEIANSLTPNSVVIGENSNVKRSSNSNKSDSARSNNASKNEDEEKIWQASSIPDVKFSDVAGLEDVKNTIRMRMINPVKYPEKYAVYNKKSGGGVLLYGPPGTGKTMIAKAIANEVGATFYAIKGSDIVSKWVGESEKNISSLFETARKDKLAIIFVDEMDSLFGQRGVDPHNDKRVNEFLQQIDGFVGRNPNLLLLGATNRPWDVDGAAVRSGRFSEKIYVPLPDAQARMYLLKKQLKNIPLGSDVDFDKVVQMTKGYSGADIDEVCDRAKEIPLNNFIKNNIEEKVCMKHIIGAIKKVRPMVSAEEIARFEEYAGVRYKDSPDEEDDIEFNDETQNDVNTNNSSVQNESSEDVTTKRQEAPKIIFEKTQIDLQPGENPTIQFYIDGDYDRVYLELDGANYVCEKCIRNWSCVVNVQEAGDYVARIFAKELLGEEKLTFSKGFVENDMEI